MQGLLLRYTQALITQMFQTAACNRHHSVEQQLCRWLLLTLDRMASNDLVMTQELVASMLGVRREGITQAAGKLQEAGFIRYRRGHISALQRAGLEQHACECYAVVKKELGRLLSDVRHRCALPLLRNRRGVCGGRGRPGPLRRGPRADTRRPRRGAAAGARSGVALVRPRRPSRPGRCTGHGRLAPRRGLLAGCLSAHRRPRPLRPGAPATLLRTTPLRPGAARAARRGPARLSLRQAAARWAHRAAAYAPGADRAPGRADPTPASAPPPPIPNAAPPSHDLARSPARILWAVLLARIYEIFSSGITRFAH